MWFNGERVNREGSNLYFEVQTTFFTIVIIILVNQHKVNRLLWAREYAKLDGTQWNNLLFSDEARFEVDAKDHKIRCYRRKNERFRPEMILEKTNRGYGSVNVWGGIIGHNKTRLIRLHGRVTSEKYINEILKKKTVLCHFKRKILTLFLCMTMPLVTNIMWQKTI